MVTLIGLDLAWTAQRPSGMCVLEEVDGEVRFVSVASECRTPGEFAGWIGGYAGDVVAAIDAPLLLFEPRLAEKALNKVYGKYDAGAFLATRAFLEGMKGMAGPLLGERLKDAGFDTFPSFSWAECERPVRVAFEMYPHAAHVEMFDLARRLTYKKGRVCVRREGLAVYQMYLVRLLRRDMPKVLEAPEVGELLSPGVLEARGRELKAVEDKLDALTCAMVAWHSWRHGAAGMRVLGDANGYIAVPRRREA